LRDNTLSFRDTRLSAWTRNPSRHSNAGENGLQERR
jgi:hypothetical protein